MTTEPDPRHGRGLLSAAERLEMLFDGAECEIAPPAADGDTLWIGRGHVHGRPALAAASDPDRCGGSLSGENLKRLARLYDEGSAGGVVVRILDSAGLRASLGAGALSALDAALAAQSRAKGRLLRIGLVCGSAIGAEALLPALDDLVAMSGAGGRWSLSGGEPARALLDEDEEDAAYGGPALHAKTTGLAAIHAEDDARTLLAVRSTIGLLRPGGAAPAAASSAFETLLPRDPLAAHDADELARLLCDGRHLQELWPDFAPGLLVALARLGGRPVGLLASRGPMAGGVLDAATAVKAERFIRLCTRLDLPLTGLVDCPGALPGLEQDEAGALARIAAMRTALRSHGGPKAMLVLRRAYGVGALAYGLFDPETNVLTWPDARIGLTPDDAGGGHGRTVEPADTQGALIDALFPRA